jgi:hypothetical protein
MKSKGAVVLIVLWAVGYFGGFAMGGLIHLLLVVAFVILAEQFLLGRRASWGRPSR